MALVACKECRKFVYEGADTCPQCGVKRPAISWEEERLEKAIEEATQRESEYAKTYMHYYNQNFIEKLFNRGMVDKYVDLANQAQAEKKKLSEQLWSLQKNKERRNQR